MAGLLFQREGRPLPAKLRGRNDRMSIVTGAHPVTYEEVGDRSQFGGHEHAQYHENVAGNDDEIDENQYHHGDDHGGIVEFFSNQFVQIVKAHFVVRIEAGVGIETVGGVQTGDRQTRRVVAVGERRRWRE